MIELSLFYLLSFTCCLFMWCTVPGSVRYGTVCFIFLFSIFSSVQNSKSLAHKRLFQCPRSQYVTTSQKCTNNNERNSWWWCSMIKNVLVHNNNFKLHVLLRTLTHIYNQFLTDFHLCNLQLWTRDKHGQHPHNPRDKNCRLHDDDDCNNHTGTMILWLIQLVIRKTLQEQSVASFQTS